MTIVQRYDREMNPLNHKKQKEHEAMREWEKSFAGYHKEAPAHLKKESEKLHAKKSIAKKMKKDSVKRADREQDKRHKAFLESQTAKEKAGHWSIMR